MSKAFKIFKKVFSLEFCEDVLVKIFRFFIHRNPLFLYFWLKFYLFDGAFRKDRENKRLFYGKYQSFNQRHPYLSAGTSFVLILAFVFSGAWWIFLKPNTAQAEWYDDAWRYRKRIYFDNSDQAENLDNFPVMIKLDDTNFDFSSAKTDGSDLRFSDSDGETLLDYEIEKYDSNNQQAVAWVNVPRINGSSSDDSIYLYWGNASASDDQDVDSVWPSNYKGVYHFGENDGTYQFDDSSGNGNNLTSTDTNSHNYQSDGKMGGSLLSSDWPNDLDNQSGSSSEMYPAVKLDANDYPVVAYYDHTALDLVLVHCDDRECKGGGESLEVLDSSGTTGLYPSLQLDSNGYPVIAYYDSSATDLNVIHCNDVNCAGGDETISSVDTSGTTGLYPSLQLDSSGYPVVAYYDSSATDVNLVHCNDLYCSGGNESIVSIEIAGTTGNAQGGISLVLDANGYPVISYYDNTNTDLKLAHCNDANCTGGDESIVFAASGTNTIGSMNSLQLDANGYPMIAYYDSTISDLMYIHCIDANCSNTPTPKTLTTSSYQYPTLEIDSSGNPIVLAMSTYPRLFICIDTNCSTDYESNITNYNQYGTYANSIAIDSDGYPVVATYARSRTELYYEVDIYITNPGIRQAYDADFNFGTGSFTASMWFKTSREVAQNYLLTRYDGDQGFKVWLDYGGHPRFGIDDDSTWSPDDQAYLNNSNIELNVDSGQASTAAEMSMRLDANGYPVIAYFDSSSSQYNLEIVHCNDVNCAGANENKNLIDIDGDVGRTPSLQLDANGYPVISYHDNTNQTLKLAHCNDVNCAGGDESIITVDNTANVGDYSSLHLDANGYPVIGYYDATNTAIKLAHCNDANCSGGDESIVTVDNNELDTPYYSTTWLKLDANGYPVMSYYNDTTDDLKIAHCNDANCSGGDESINTPVTSGTTGLYSSLELNSSGYPVIAYYNSSTWDLKLMTCNDANCAGANETVNAIEANKDSGYYYVDLELNSSGIPVILHTSLARWMQVLTVCGDATCSGGNTDNYIRQDPYNYYYGSLELDVNDYPVVAMARSSDLTLLHMDNTTTYNNTNAYDDQQWHHLVAVRNGTSSIKLYMDGVEVASDTSLGASGTLTSDSAELHIGENLLMIGSKKYWVDSFGGQIDEVQIDNTARSADWIAAQYLSENGELAMFGRTEVGERADDPAGYWKFNEGSGSTAHDSTVNGNDGTISGATWADESACVSGRCLSFDGTNNISINDPLGQNNLQQEWTVSAWIKLNSDGGDGNQYLISGMNHGIELNHSTTNKALLYLNSGDDDYYIYGTTDLKDGQWHHVTFLFKNSDGYRKIYIDGKNDSSSGSNKTSTPSGINSTLNIGSGTKGYLDEIKIYPYVRTEDQIKQDYNAGIASSGTPRGTIVSYGGQTDRVLDDMLVAHWKFDEGAGGTAHDSTANGNDGTISGAAWSDEGKFGKSLSFDGLDDYVSLGNVGSYESFSLSAWVNIAANPDYSYESYFSLGNGSLLRFSLESNTLKNSVRWKHLDGSYGTYYLSSDNSLGNWNHFIATYDGLNDVLKGYRNGILEYTHSDLGIYEDFGGVSYIGKNYSNDAFFDGKIDEVKIYNKALSEEEVLRDYNQGKSLVMGSGGTTSDGVTPSNAASREYCIPGDTSTCNPPVAEWKFDENTGTTAYDTTGNGNDGTLTNGPKWTVGKEGPGLEFDGSDDYIEMGDVLDMGMDDMTISIWLNTEYYETRRYLLSKSRATSQDYRYGVALDPTGVGRIFMQGDGGPDFTLNGNIFIADGKWHNVEFIFDRDGDAEIYVDGVYDAGGSIAHWSSADMDSINPFRIGTYTTSDNIGTSSPFLGKIDNVKVYDYIRTPAQIAWDYNRGKPIGWWKMDEGEGSVAHDASGNGNDGTLTNTTINAWVNGKNNGALELDEDGYVNLGNPSQLNFTPTDYFSLGGWIYVDETFPLWHSATGQWLDTTSTFFGRGSTSGSVGIGIFSYWNDTGNQYIKPTLEGVNFLVGSRAVDQIAYWSPDIEFNKYYHIHFVYTPGMQYTYINGELVDSRDNSAGLGGSFDQDNWGIFTAMACPGGNNGNIAGLADDVRIYNYALTPLQVKEVYNGGAVNYR